MGVNVGSKGLPHPLHFLESLGINARQCSHRMSAIDRPFIPILLAIFLSNLLLRLSRISFSDIGLNFENAMVHRQRENISGNSKLISAVFTVPTDQKILQASWSDYEVD